MEFEYTTPDINFPVTRLLSKGGKWECGFYPVIFGVRFRIGKAGEGYVDCDICCGDDPIIRCLVLKYCLDQMEKLDESKVTHRMISDMFPLSKVKPVDRDPEWCKRLNIELKERHFV